MQKFKLVAVQRWAPLVLAILAPAIMITALPSPSSKFTALLACFGLVLVSAVFARSIDRMQRADEAVEEQMRPVLAQARSAGSRLDQLQRRIVELQAIPAALDQIKSLINGERHNLSLVAAGVAELRDVVDGERTNLGKIASAVSELREAEAGRASASSTAVAKVEEFDDMMEAIHVHLSTLSDRVDNIATAFEGERRNLGLVAGGLDSLRRSVVGVEALNARYAALSDGLVIVADYIDALAPPSTIPVTERVDLAAD